MNIDINNVESLKMAINAIKQLNALGLGKAYIVGGCVRDILRGISPSDYDIATNIPLDVIEKNFNTADIGRSKEFGIFAVIIDGNVYEVAQFRTDSTTSEDARHPDSVYLTDVSIKDDADRRDLTINALYMDSEYSIIDFHDGYNDIIRRELKFVGDGVQRLDEDVLRLFRVLRFAATLNFEITEQTHDDIMKFLGKTSKAGIHDITTMLSVERTTAELIKVAKHGGKAMARYIELLYDYNLLTFVLPEIAASDDVYHYWEHHPEGSLMRLTVDGSIHETNLAIVYDGYAEVTASGSVFEHVISALENVREDASYVVVLATLFHDVGKPAAAEKKDDNPIAHSFKNHQVEGRNIFVEVVAPRMKLSSALTDELAFAIRYHLDFFVLLDMKKAKVLNIALSPFLDTLIEVCYADDHARGEELTRDDQFERVVEHLYDRRDNYADEEALRLKIKERINGKKVIDIRGDIEGRLIGEILAKVKDKLIETDFEMTDEEIEKIIKEK